MRENKPNTRNKSEDNFQLTNNKDNNDYDFVSGVFNVNHMFFA